MEKKKETTTASLVFESEGRTMSITRMQKTELEEVAMFIKTNTVHQIVAKDDWKMFLLEQKTTKIGNPAVFISKTINGETFGVSLLYYSRDSSICGILKNYWDYSVLCNKHNASIAKFVVECALNLPGIFGCNNIYVESECVYEIHTLTTEYDFRVAKPCWDTACQTFYKASLPDDGGCVSLLRGI